jgi:sugar phosphate isomerase/epimerase
MQFGISTFFYTCKSLREVIHEALSAGITAIELMYDLPHVDQMDSNFIDTMCTYKEQGVVFSMHAPFLEVNIGSFFEEMRDFSLKRIKKAIDVASLIGCDPIVLHSGYTFMYKIEDIRHTTYDYFIEDLREIIRHGNERGLRIGLENVYMPYFFFSSTTQFKEFHNLIPDIRCTLDIGHAFLTKRLKGEQDPEGAMLNDIDEIGIDNIIHVHIHNNNGLRDDHLFLTGQIDLRRILQGLSERDYNGKVIIESHDMEEYGIDRIIKKLKSIVPYHEKI